MYDILHQLAAAITGRAIPSRPWHLASTHFLRIFSLFRGRARGRSLIWHGEKRAWLRCYVSPLLDGILFFTAAWRRALPLIAGWHHYYMALSIIAALSHDSESFAMNNAREGR